MSIVSKESLQVVKRSALFYAANTILAPLAGFVLVLLLSPIYPVSTDRLLLFFFEGYAVVITVYAVFVFLRIRSGRLVGVGSHSLAAGFLGFFAGSALFSYAGWRFVSVGYWVRQLVRGGGLRCARDGSSLVVYGEEQLACPKCSRIVNVGYDIPKGWVRAGMVLVGLAVASYLVAILFRWALPTDVLWIVANFFLVNGLGFLFFYFNPQRLMAGRVRIELPTETGA